MIVLIDNYDSFTFNLYQYIGQTGHKVCVIRNDEMSAHDIMSLSPQGIILSPGPCTPNEAGVSINIAKACHDTNTHLLGICLGHQAIAQSFGASIVKTVPKHGKVSSATHNGLDIFKGCISPFHVTRYHSLTIQPDTLPDDFAVTAYTSDDNIIMGISHKTSPLYGVQFHPESIATPDGFQIIQNFTGML